MKRLVLILLLSVPTFVWAANADEVENSFLSVENQKAVKDALLVTATDLPAMTFVPLAVPGYSGYHVRLNSMQIEFLRKELLAAKTLNDPKRLENCNYQPGIALNFYQTDLAIGASNPPFGGYSEHASLTVLLCFNCDVWAIIPRAGESGGTISFKDGVIGRTMPLKAFEDGAIDRRPHLGDSKTSRKALLNFVRELFPHFQIEPKE